MILKQAGVCQSKSEPLVRVRVGTGIQPRWACPAETIRTTGRDPIQNVTTENILRGLRVQTGPLKSG